MDTNELAGVISLLVGVGGIAWKLQSVMNHKVMVVRDACKADIAKLSNSIEALRDKLEQAGDKVDEGFVRKTDLDREMSRMKRDLESMDTRLTKEITDLRHQIAGQFQAMLTTVRGVLTRLKG